jgi:hypothetical protein
MPRTVFRNTSGSNVSIAVPFQPGITMVVLLDVLLVVVFPGTLVFVVVAATVAVGNPTFTMVVIA